MVIKNVNLFSMTSERIQQRTSLYICNGIIKEIGNYNDLNIPPNTLIINGEDKYLTPGFSDMHVHAYKEVSLYLANGVTTIKICGTFQTI